MKHNTHAGDVSDALLTSIGDKNLINKRKNNSRQVRRQREREALRKRRVIATSIPAGKGFQ